MASAKTNNELSCVTFNTFGTPFFAPDLVHRYNRIAQELNRGPYDIICLQEVFSYFNFYLLKKRMPNFPYIAYEKTIIGPRGGLVIFSKYPLSQQTFTEFSYPQDATIPFYTKIIQHGFLAVSLKDFSLRIATTHLSSDLEHNLTSKDKLYKLIRSQLEETASALNQQASKYARCIVLGDFNIAKHSELYTLFLKQTKAKDIFKSEEMATYYYERFKYIYITPRDSRVDFMFSKNHGKAMDVVKTTHIMDKPVSMAKNKKSYLSDHIGLHCILRVNK